MDITTNNSFTYKNIDFNAKYNKTKIDVNFKDKNINFSMTFEKLEYSFKKESLSFNKENVYDQSKIADIINKGDFDKLNDIFKELQAKSSKTTLKYTNTQINSSINSIKIENLTPQQASELISDDGFFGINKTSKRVFDFVINGANDNPELLKAGRDGIIQGLKDAEEIWGGKLPDIAYKTQTKTLSMLDEYMAKLGIISFDTKG